MTIKLTLDRIEGEMAVLKTENSATIIWPVNQLPSNIYEGMILIFKVSGEKETEMEEKKRAKEILNEILNINS